MGLKHIGDILVFEAGLGESYNQNRGSWNIEDDAIDHPPANRHIELEQVIGMENTYVMSDTLQHDRYPAGDGGARLAVRGKPLGKILSTEPLPSTQLTITRSAITKPSEMR